MEGGSALGQANGQSAAAVQRIEGGVGGQEQTLALGSVVGRRGQLVIAQRGQLPLTVHRFLARGREADRSHPSDRLGRLLGDPLDLLHGELVQRARPGTSEDLHGIVIERWQSRQQETTVAARRASSHDSGIDPEDPQAEALCFEQRREPGPPQSDDTHIRLGHPAQRGIARWIPILPRRVLHGVWHDAPP